MDKASLIKELKRRDNEHVVTQQTLCQLCAMLLLSYKIDKKQKNTLNDLFIYDEILDSTTDGWWNWNFKTNTGYVSPKFKQLLGYSDKELQNSIEQWQRIIYQDDLPLIKEAFEAQIKHGKACETTVRYHCKDGSTKWALCRGKIFQHSDNNDLFMMGTLTDLTDLKETEQTLQRKFFELELIYTSLLAVSDSSQMNHLLQNFINLMCEKNTWPIGHVYQLDPTESKMISTNIWFIASPNKMKTFKAITEKSTFKLGMGLPGRVWELNRPLWIPVAANELISERAHACHKLNLCQAIALPIIVEGKTIAVCEFFLDNPQNGTSTLIKAFEILSKHIGHAIERLFTLDKLEKSESMSRLLLESSGKGIYGVDIEGRVTFINQAAATLLGYHSDELVGTMIHNVIHHSYPDGRPYPVAQCPIYNAFRDGKIHHVTDEVLWKKNGDPIPVEYFSSPLYQEKKLVGAMVTFSDISERKNTEKKLLNYAVALKKSNADLDDFAYIVSHDLKAPLRAIDKISQWIVEDCNDKIDNQSKVNLALLRKQTQRMRNLINGVLEYSRVGRTHIELSSVDTYQLIQEVIHDIHPSKKFAIQYTGHFPVIKTAKLPLSQVFFNLIHNSIIHHHRKDGIIEIGVHDLNDVYEFYVSDDGPGIEPEYFEKIFQVFQRLQSKDTIESTGLGLSIVKKIVENLGGKVTIESMKGQGATFRFTWPKSMPASE